MNIRYLILLILLAFWAFTQHAVGQCYNCGSQFPTSTFSTTSNSLTQVTICAYGGEYSVYNVTVGETYTWTTCGGGAWDTQLTLFTGNTCGTGLLAYNDDDCGLQSTITWTATFTGQVNLLISRYNCLSQESCMAINWACISCGTGGDGYNNPGGTITTCSGNFYDTGGPTGNYGNNQFITTTFCPDIPGECINMSFSQFGLENGWDDLTVFNGPNTASPVIGTYTGTALQGVTLSATNPSGCLTFVFDSDGSNIITPYFGWSASISCSECGTSPPAPPQDCNGGITICSDETFNGNSSGPGVQELNASNQGCLASENESTWFFFSPQSTGTIAFMLEPTPMVDYDFAIWGPYDEPICPPPGPPLRCSWSALWAPTGLQAGAGDNSEGAGGDAIVNPITVGPAQVGQVYIMMIDNWTASTTPYTFNWNLDGGLILDCTVLPVELLELTGARVGDHIILRWKTASETNSDYFSVERSADGANYQQIGTVQAAGFSNSPLSYVYRDENPGNQRYYYRLKQVDFDGKFEYLGPVAIDGMAETSRFGKPYPNPSESGEYFIEVNFTHNLSLQYTLLDATGRPVLQKSVTVSKGHQTLQIDGSRLASGVYQLQFSDDLGQVLHTTSLLR